MKNSRQRNGEVEAFEKEEAEAEVAHENGRVSDVVLGLDGGTTSTVCVCMPLLPFSDHDLADPPPVLARAVAGCSNHNSVGETASKNTLEQVMAETLCKSGSTWSAVRAVCLGVSGVNHPRDQERILKWLRDIFPSHVKLYVHNDALAALASGTMGKLHGCVLIAGTGCISYGVSKDGREARAAGAGPVLGDWGSGYGIAAQALTAVVKAHDGRGQQTMLTDSILKALGLSSPDELIGWTYADPSWARIAALVPEVVSCAEAGDQIANKILVEAVQELAVCVKAVAQRLCLCGEDGNGSFPIVMVGGVLEANKSWDIGKEVINCIRKQYPEAYPIRPKKRKHNARWGKPSLILLSPLHRWAVQLGGPLPPLYGGPKVFVLEEGGVSSSTLVVQARGCRMGRGSFHPTVFQHHRHHSLL